MLNIHILIYTTTMRELILILFLAIHSIANSQTIYSEDFSDDWKKGATTYGGVSASQPADNNWSYVVVGSPALNGGSATSWNDMAFMDGASVMSTNGSNPSTLAFRWNDVNNGSSTDRVDWYSKEILGDYTAVSISLDYAIGSGSGANSVWAYYIIDGGAATLFGSSVNQTTASGTFTVSSLTARTSIKVYVRAQTRNANSAYVLIDNVTVSGATALPIELLYLKGKPVDKGNLIEWATATEQNNDYFTLLWSDNGHNFAAITRIPGTGSSVRTLEYHYLDETPSRGVNYYKLRQTDYDGRFEDSEIISVLSDKDTAPTIVDCRNLLGQKVSPEERGVVILTISKGNSMYVVKKVNE